MSSILVAILFALVGAAGVWALFPRWQRILPILLGLLLVEGTFRRLLPGQPFEVILIKDVFLGLAYLSYARWIVVEDRELWVPPFQYTLGAFALVVAALAITNPFSPFVSLAGIHSYLWYVPLIWLARDAIQTEEGLRRLLVPFTALAIPLLLLGIAQTVAWEALPAFLLPLEGAHVFHSTSVGNIRLPSSFLGTHFRYGNVSLFMLLAGLASLPRSRGRAETGLVAAGSIAAFVSLFIASSRGASFFGLLSLFVFLGYWGKRRLADAEEHPLGEGPRWAANTLIGLVILLIGLLVYALFPDRAIFNLMDSLEAVPAYGSVVLQHLHPAFVAGGLFGVGLGVSAIGGTQGLPGAREAASVVRSAAEAGPTGIETGPGSLLWSVGLVGLVAFYAFIADLAARVLGTIRGADVRLRPYAVGLALFPASMFAMFHKGAVYLHDPTTAILAWTSLGFVFAVGQITDADEPALNPASHDASAPVHEWIAGYKRTNIARNREAFPDHEEDPWARFKALARENAPDESIILDLGAGPVDAGQAWLDRRNGTRIVSLDGDREALDENPNRARILGDLEELPLPDASVDLALNRYVLEHLERPEHVFQEVERTLRPGGAFVFVAPHAWAYPSLVARLTPLSFHESFRRLGEGSDVRAYPTYYRANTPWTIEAAARRAGLELEHIEGHVGPPEYTAVLPPVIHEGFVRFHRLLERSPRLQRLFGPVLVGVLRKRKDSP